MYARLLIAALNKDFYKMKKLFLAIFCALGLFGLLACSNSTSSELSKDNIYFFYQTTCPHCHDAARYIKANYPTLKMTALDIKLPGNMKLFEKALKQYNITGSAGTPLFLMGDKYIMGWSNDKQNEFDLYVKPYLK